VWILNKLKLIGGERKKFFAKCKTRATSQLLEQLQGKRIVIYTGSVEQCDELGGDRAVHSKKGRKYNIEVLRKFNNKEIDTIYFNNMGAEGLNLMDIDVAVIVQLSTGKDENLGITQRGGRAFRSSSPEIYILFCENSKDEEWKNEAIKIYKPEWIKTMNIKRELEL